MDTVMLSLGGYQFSINTAAYQQLERVTAQRWSSQERFGQGPLLQLVGQEAETVRLDGLILPTFRGGLVQLDKLREEQAKGVPLTLITALGFVLGEYVIERITERQTEFAQAGLPLRVEFGLELRRYDNNAGNVVKTSNYTGPEPTGPYNPGPRPGVVRKEPTKEQAYVSRLGDVLDRIVQRHYGKLGGRVLERVMDRNRGIGDLGAVLPAGTKIELPSLPDELSTKKLPKLWD